MTDLAKLTTEQEAMLSSCLALDCAWVTSVDGDDNLRLLEDWNKAGWAREVEAPAFSRKLRAFKLTEAGHRALSARSP